MKKTISLLLSFIMLIGVLSVSFSSYASGWAANAQDVNLNTWYNDYFGSQGSEYCAYRIYLSAKGKITVRTQCDDTYIYTYLYKSNNIDTYLNESNSKDDHSSGGGYYWREESYNLNPGYYYVVFYNNYNYNFDFKASYTPTFSKTSLIKVSAKNNAFSAKWNKCSGVSGYQLQYSLKSGMGSAKTIKIAAKYYGRTVKKLKDKRRYYVRIRTYKTVKVNGKNKTFYSKWSGKKSVITK
ncbi:MAG: hypothetical protein IJI47_01960 [Eubacterium sp.]|nr:hypothetical protein [Eubacterium sp.]